MQLDVMQEGRWQMNSKSAGYHFYETSKGFIFAVLNQCVLDSMVNQEN